jgi:excisionase family DNA binding protein
LLILMLSAQLFGCFRGRWLPVTVLGVDKRANRRTGRAAMPSTLSVKEVAERYAVSEHTVLGWIKNCELRAINVGRRLGAGKPRWRVTQEALEKWELLRTPTPPMPQIRRRKRADDGVIEFYK